MSWYLEALRKYAVFSGRARRREYWFFLLFNVLIGIALVTIDVVLGTYDEANGFGVLSGVYYLGVLVPSIAVTIRRLHDTGRSGWWFLLSFVPLGGLVVLVFTLLDGEPGPNAYGDDPKGRLAPYAAMAGGSGPMSVSGPSLAPPPPPPAGPPAGSASWTASPPAPQTASVAPAEATPAPEPDDAATPGVTSPPPPAPPMPPSLM